MKKADSSTSAPEFPPALLLIFGLLVATVLAHRSWLHKANVRIFVAILDAAHVALMFAAAWLGARLSGAGRHFPKALGGLIVCLFLFLAHYAWVRLTMGAHRGPKLVVLSLLHPLALHPWWMNGTGRFFSEANLMLGLWYWTWACAAAQAIPSWRRPRSSFPYWDSK